MISDAASKRFARIALLIALGLFLVLGAHQLSLPGLHYDEAKEAGVNAMQIVTGQPVTAFRDAKIRIGPLEFPLMVQDYIGATNVLLAVPFLALGGVNEVALRWMPLLLAVLTIILSWRVAGGLGGPIAAGITALLLAVNPSFVFWSRQGIFVTNLTALLLVAVLHFALRWHQRHKAFDLCATAFLMGLGIYAKLLFVWVIVGLLVIAAFIWIYERRERRKQQPASLEPDNQPVNDRGIAPDWPTLLAAGICFMLPLVPLIIFNLRTAGTMRAIFDNLGNSYYGVNNAAYLTNLRVRIEQLGALLRGDHFWYLGEAFANPFAPWLAAGLLFFALVFAMPVYRRRLLAVVGLFLLAIAQSAFTVSDLFITHYAMLLPLAMIAVGVAAAGLYDRTRNVFAASAGLASLDPARVGMALGLLTAVTLWWTADLWTTARYHEVLSLSGGYAAHSDAIYALADYLDQFEPAAPLALDWGLDSPVRFLTVGRVNPLEVFGYDSLNEPDPGFAGRVAPFLADPSTLYVTHAPDATVFKGRVEALRELAGEQGLELEETARFAERNGRPLYIVYRAELPHSE